MVWVVWVLVPQLTHIDSNVSKMHSVALFLLNLLCDIMVALSNMWNLARVSF